MVDKCCELLTKHWLEFFSIVLSLVLSGVTGHLIGWIAGASQSPVATTLLPIVFSVLTIFGISNALSGKTDKLTSALMLALVTNGLIFIICCNIGLKVGISDRIGLTTAEALSKFCELNPELSPTEKELLTGAFFRLRSDIRNQDDQELVILLLSKKIERFRENTKEYKERKERKEQPAATEGGLFSGVGEPHLDEPVVEPHLDKPEPHFDEYLGETIDAVTRYFRDSNSSQNSSPIYGPMGGANTRK